jgi:hypothetical protein
MSDALTTSTMHVMLDLETMSSASNAAIVAIGAVIFDERHILERFVQAVDLQSEKAAGADVSADTIMWWMQQSGAARRAIKNGLAAPVVLRAFAAWLESHAIHQDVAIWGNGAGFDNVVLSNAYLRHGIARPWSYRGDRCFRTIRHVYPGVPEPERIGIAHNALDDSMHQARWLQAICDKHNISLG